ncbi:MAG: tyrosine-type recombinase/integrase [Gemmatimonadales bacterium]
MNRVRVYTHRSGTLFAEYRRNGIKIRDALGHRDREQAKVEADELAAALRRPDRKIAVTLNQLFDNYLRDVTPTKSLTSQKHDKTTLDRFRQMLDGKRAAESLTYRDAAKYERDRRNGGDLRPRARVKGKKAAPYRPLKSRSIIYDIRLLRATFNWGIGAGLVDRNPLTGYKVSELETPKRPVFTDAQYRSLLKVADQFPWQFGCLLVLAHETGHRLSAVLNLQWRDVSLTSGRISWRAENDKIGYEHVTPITDGARDAVEVARRHAPGIGDAPIVPGPKNQAAPVGPNLARDWLERAQVSAGLPVEKGRGWHAFRRNFASELRNASLRDLCDLGGWKDPTTVVKCYQRPSEDAMRIAQAQRTALEG